MRREPLPPPSSGFRPGDLMRLALAISFLFLIVLAIVRFRNPATWQWVRGVAPSKAAADATEKPASQVPEPEPEPTDLPVLMYERAQLGIVCAGATLAVSGEFPVESLSFALLALEAPAYAKPIPKPKDDLIPPRLARRTLPPDWRFLRGARDREPFLIEPPADPDNPLFSRERADADARYHLIQLVLEQARGAQEHFLQSLHADASWNVPYENLRDKPHHYRGQVIGLKGTLVWVKRLALERGGRGLIPEHIYHGILEQDGLRDRPVWILFTELPPDFPPEKEWPRLFRDNTTFVGYYLKVVQIEAPPDPRSRASAKPRPGKLYFPVVVGYTVELPPAPPPENWRNLLLTVAGIVGGIILVAAVALYFYYRSERPYLEKMARVRARVARREEMGITMENGAPTEFRLEDASAEPGPSPATPGSEQPPPSSPTNGQSSG